MCHGPGCLFSGCGVTIVCAPYHDVRSVHCASPIRLTEDGRRHTLIPRLLGEVVGDPHW
jgi:hypothetical protein